MLIYCRLAKSWGSLAKVNGANGGRNWEIFGDFGANVSPLFTHVSPKIAPLGFIKFHL